MKLPKIQHPIFTLQLPSTKQDIKYRPFLVKEEKILLFAQQSTDPRDVLNAVKQIISNCIESEGVSVEAFTTYDVEYFFLQLRAKSVNNEVKLAYIDNEDKEKYTFEVNLDEIKVKFPEGHNNRIVINETSGITLKEPTFGLLDTIRLDDSADVAFDVIARCLETVYENDTVYNVADFSEEDVFEFIQSLDVGTFQKIQTFFDTMPKLEYVIEYKNKMDHDRKIVLNSLNDFFMLG